MEIMAVYFDKPGEQNTSEVLGIAKQRAKELSIKTVLVASTTGSSAVKAVEQLPGLRIIVVTESVGIRQSNIQEFTDESRRIVENRGGVILTTSHAFAGLSKAMRDKFKTITIGDIVANTLSIFGQGMKVACEISIMAADCGLIRTDEDVIAIAGTSKGIDTAIVLRPDNSHHFFDIKIKEILCKPHSSF